MKSLRLYTTRVITTRTYWRSSGVKYAMQGYGIGQEKSATRLESSRLVLVKVDSTYWKSNRERLRVKYTKDMGQGKKSRRLDSTRVITTRLGKSRVDLLEVQWRDFYFKIYQGYGARTRCLTFALCMAKTHFSLFRCTSVCCLLTAFCTLMNCDRSLETSEKLLQNSACAFSRM